MEVPVNSSQGVSTLSTSRGSQQLNSLNLASQELFQTSKSVPKSLLLKHYREIQKITQLLVAPLGLEDIDICLGNFDVGYVVEEYETLYKQWEEVVTRIVYKERGLSEPAVAATLHHLATDQDKDILSELQAAMSAVRTMVAPPDIIEFPHHTNDSSLTDQRSDEDFISDILHPSTAAILLTRVLSAVQKIVKSFLTPDFLSTYPLDKSLDFPILSTRSFNPLELSTTSAPENSLLWSDLQALSEALTIRTLDKRYPVIEVSVSQYHCLLAMFASSNEVQEVLSQFLLNDGALYSEYKNIIDNHLPIPLSTLSWFGLHPRLTNPTITYSAILSYKQDKVLINDLVADSETPKHELVDEKVKQIVNAQKSFSSGKESIERESYVKSMKSLDAALKGNIVKKSLKNKNRRNKYRDDEDDDEDDEDEDDEDDEDDDDEDDDGEDNEEDDEDETKSDTETKPTVIIPAALEVEILAARANCRALMIEREIGGGAWPLARAALQDCARGISLNPYCSALYAARSKLLSLLALIITSQSASKFKAVVNHDITDVIIPDKPAELASESILKGDIDGYALASIPKIESTETLRMGAAEDILAAFVLGGSSDISLAAIAENTVRDACRDTARTIYKNRGKSSLSEANQALPRPWFIQAFYAGYELLSDAFGILPLPLSKTSPIPSHLLDHDSEPTNEDSQGYALLQELVEIIDAFVESPTEKDILSTSKNEEDAVVPLIHHDDLSSLQSQLQSLHLIDCGVAETIEQPLPTHVGDIKETVNPLGRIIELLRSDIGVAASGVVFDEAGRIISVAPARENENENEEEDDDEDWEDVDDDDEDPEEDVEEDDDNKETASESVGKISRALRSRLLNVCSSISYLCGDANSAVLCLRIAMSEDKILMDNYLKLGALLIDMDEPDEAKRLFEKVGKGVTGYNRRRDPYLLLHKAELAIHNSVFDEALSQLSTAYSIVEEAITPSNILSKRGEGLVEHPSYRLATTLIDMYGSDASEAEREAIVHRRGCSMLRLLVNLACLRGVATFRVAPDNPEAALRGLKSAKELVDKHVDCVEGGDVFLTLSLGEVASQTGDTVLALKYFSEAATGVPSNPLPYANAARCYQQLQQHALAELHLQIAIEKDPTLAQTWVDLAQGRSLSGHPEEAMEALDKALQYARHVSEIREVLVGRAVTKLLLGLQKRGVYAPPKDV